MQGNEQNSSINGGDAPHKSMRDVQVLERCGLKKIVSHACVAVRAGPDTYKEAEENQSRDRWI